MLQTYAVSVAPGKSERVSANELDLAELFQEHYSRIYNYARYRVGSIDDAEDLVSTIFEQAFKNRKKFDSSRGTFSTWLFRIAHNELVSHHRKRNSRWKWETDIEPPVDLVIGEASPEARVIHKETVVQVIHSLAHLSERDQEIISLKFAGRLRNKEIGQIMDLKEKTVSVILLRAVRRLRQQLEEEPV
jgi:RNA polymerase sigma-70 factor (ECF subfamily)